MWMSVLGVLFIIVITRLPEAASSTNQTLNIADNLNATIRIEDQKLLDGPHRYIVTWGGQAQAAGSDQSAIKEECESGSDFMGNSEDFPTPDPSELFDVPLFGSDEIRKQPDLSD